MPFVHLKFGPALSHLSPTVMLPHRKCKQRIEKKVLSFVNLWSLIILLPNWGQLRLFLSTEGHYNQTKHAQFCKRRPVPLYDNYWQDGRRSPVSSWGPRIFTWPPPCPGSKLHPVHRRRRMGRQQSDTHRDAPPVVNISYHESHFAVRSGFSH